MCDKLGKNYIPHGSRHANVTADQRVGGNAPVHRPVEMKSREKKNLVTKQRYADNMQALDYTKRISSLNFRPSFLIQVSIFLLAKEPILRPEFFLNKQH
jgi:hypothetical protein